METLIVDCARCLVRGPGCADCVITALLDAPAAEPTAFAPDEQQALELFAASGMLPPLRLVQPRGTPLAEGEAPVAEKMRRFRMA